jgi:hypothetical protein
LGGISNNGKTKICINDKGFKINQDTYISILENYLLDFTDLAYPEGYWILMDDNARSGKKLRSGKKNMYLTI